MTGPLERTALQYLVRFAKFGCDLAAPGLKPELPGLGLITASSSGDHPRHTACQSIKLVPRFLKKKLISPADLCPRRYACCPQPTTYQPSGSTPPHFPLLLPPQCLQAIRQSTSLPTTLQQYSTPQQTSTKHSQNMIYKHIHLLPHLRTQILLILS